MKQINQPILLSWVFLFSLAIIWGVNFLFIKLAVSEVGPITNVFLRLIIASLILYACMVITGNKLNFQINYLIFYFAIGSLGLAIPFFLIKNQVLQQDRSHFLKDFY